MKIVRNTGTDRVIDIVRPWLQADNRVDLASRTLSLFAFGELVGDLARTAKARLVLSPDEADLDLLGSVADRVARNGLQGRWLAGRCADWIENTAEVRRARAAVPQGAMVLRNGDGRAGQGLLGSFSFSTDGLGLAPGNPLNLVPASESPEECERLGAGTPLAARGRSPRQAAAHLTHRGPRQSDRTTSHPDRRAIPWR